jgi:hypothetical protein
MTKLEPATLWRFGIWMVVGLVVYVVYSHSHSRLRRGEDPVGVDGGGGDDDDGPRFTRDPTGGGTSSTPVEHRLQ